MKIVFTDANTIGADIDLSGFERFGEVCRYGFLTPDELPDAVRDADIIIANKTPMNESTLKGAAKLKLICVTATGTNNLDKDYLASRGIEWRNVAGYSTECVAQHTFALLFYLWEKLSYYDDYVKSGTYAGDKCFTHFAETFNELAGKTWGIIGLGNIGRRVAGIAQAFGCRVIYSSPSGAAPQDGYTQVPLKELLANSDIVSVHSPLNEYTEGLMNRDAFALMKPSAVFLNLARGPIVVEEDLAQALENGVIAAAGLDVLCEEPMNPNSPLLRIKDSRKLLITPHIAWAGVETRTRLMGIIEGQIENFLDK